MFKKVLLIFSVLIIALNFIFLNLTNSALETQLLVDVSTSSDNVPYTQTQWYGFNATAEQGYCAILTSLTGNSDAYLFDTDFNLVGFSKNSGTTEDKVWYGGSVSGPMHIACFGADNPSSNFTIQVISAPYVKDISPNAGSVGTLVTLTGLGFGATRGTSYVKFGTATATNYSSWTNTEIKVYVPSGVASGTIQAVVYVASKASNPMNFAATGASSDGTMWRYDLARTGNYPDGPTSLPLSLKWKYNLPWSSNWNAPVIANNVLYVPIDKYLYVFDASTGSRKWTYGSSYTGGSPAIANGIVYIADSIGTLYALDAGNGSLKWRKTVSTYYGGFSTAVFNGVVYFNKGDKVYALDANTGDTKWSYSVTSDWFEYTPAIANGILYAASYQKVYALDANTGSVKWIYTASQGQGFSSITAKSLAISNGVVYLGGYSDYYYGKIYALDANTGTLKWSYATVAEVTTSCAVANGIVYFGCKNNKLYALDAATGTLKWNYSVPVPSGDVGGIYSCPVVSNAIVYFGARDNKVYALDGATGLLRWSYDIGNDFASQIVASPAISDGRVYISSGTKGVYCFGQ